MGGNEVSGVFRVVAAVFLGLFLAAGATVAQMPGAGVEAEKTSPAGTAAGAQPGSRAGSDLGWFGRQYHKYLGEDSAYRPIILTLATLVLLLALKNYLTRKLKAQLKAHAFMKENARSFLKTWNGVWKFIIAVLLIMAMSGSFRLLGLTAGFMGMMLGWSLQQPVTGIAAWLMIILKKPFRIGDRVVIAGITGDVTGISLTHVTLNQVGGSIGGEERSGRGILIPNAILFQNVIINYTLEQKYMLDEVPVRLTFDCDWERAKELMLAAAREVTGEIIAQTGETPFIRAEFLEYGILVRLRYNTLPMRRQEISTDIIEKLLASFRKEYPRVKFAIPATFVLHRAAGGREGGGVPGEGGPV